MDRSKKPGAKRGTRKNTISAGTYKERLMVKNNEIPPNLSLGRAWKEYRGRLRNLIEGENPLEDRHS